MEDKDIYTGFVNQTFCKNQHDATNAKLDMLIKLITIGNGTPSILTRIDRLEEKLKDNAEKRKEESTKTKEMIRLIGPYVINALIIVIVYAFSHKMGWL